jgi:hypothetical protein
VSAVAAHPGPAMGIEAPPARQVSPTLFERDRATLEDVVLRVWEDLGLEGHAGCPVCGGPMSASGCDDCGAELE